MELLEPNQYDRVRPLFAGLDDQLAVAAILAGSAPARIYVDDTARPTAACSWTGHHFFLAGSPEAAGFHEDLRRLFADMIYPQAPAWGLEMLELKYAPEAWADVITGVILRDKNLMPAWRHYYVYRALPSAHKPLLPARGQPAPTEVRLPEGYRLTFIDADLLAQTHIAHLDALCEELRSERPSVAYFLAQSFGIAALCADELAGWCTSEYNTGERCEVGIGVLAPHQRRGLATAMGSAFRAHALAQGITRIGWHCWANNAPSIATALKLGYEKAAEYRTFIAWFDKVG